jgi:GNAT superfamily N-acetyltransferase
MPETPFNLPELLTKAHDCSRFDCGKSPLNDFLQKHALQNQIGGGARTYVLTRGAAVIGYYSLAPASVAIEEAPARVLKGQARHPVPVILMARFALDQAEHGKGMGKALLRNAFSRALAGAETVGGRAFMVQAKDAEAMAFYAKFGMEPSPTDPMMLFLLFKDIRQALGE